MVQREHELQQLTSVKDTILTSCHPNALPVIKQSFAILQAAWHRVLLHVLLLLIHCLVEDMQSVATNVEQCVEAIEKLMAAESLRVNAD